MTHLFLLLVTLFSYPILTTNTMSSAELPIGVCVRPDCGGISHYYCQACCDVPLYYESELNWIFYCHAQCQRIHEKDHRPVCEERQRAKRLLRVAYILKQVALIWHEHAWRFDYKGVMINRSRPGINSGELQIVRGDGTNWRVGRFFQECPQDLLSAVSGPWREAFLLSRSNVHDVSLLSDFAGVLLIGTFI